MTTVTHVTVFKKPGNKKDRSSMTTEWNKRDKETKEQDY